MSHPKDKTAMKHSGTINTSNNISVDGMTDGLLQPAEQTSSCIVADSYHKNPRPKMRHLVTDDAWKGSLQHNSFVYFSLTC